MTTNSYSHLARENRLKVIQNLQSLGAPAGVVYLRGMETTERKWTDCEVPFRQESNFFYMTGMDIPDCHLLVDLGTKKAHLFIPEYGEDYALWCGAPPSVGEVRSEFGVEHAGTVEDIPGVLKALDPQMVHVLEKENVVDVLGSYAEKVEKAHLTT